MAGGFFYFGTKKPRKAANQDWTQIAELVRRGSFERGARDSIWVRELKPYVGSSLLVSRLTLLNPQGLFFLS
jgi:hypothetical protein